MRQKITLLPSTRKEKVGEVFRALARFAFAAGFLHASINVCFRFDAGLLGDSRSIAQEFAESQVGEFTDFVKSAVEPRTTEPPFAGNSRCRYFTGAHFTQNQIGIELQITRGLFDGQNFGDHHRSNQDLVGEDEFVHFS